MTAIAAAKPMAVDTALDRAQSGELAKPSPRKVHRVITDCDVPWMVELAKARYPKRFDIDSAELWFRGVVLKQPTVFHPIRTDHAFLVTLIAIIPWTPSEHEANVVMLCAEDGHLWDAIRLVRASIEWAGRRRCAKWQLNSDTEFDLAPIARLMGANVLTPRYSIRFQP